MYILFFLQQRTIDQPLTHIVGNQSAWVLNKIYYSTAYAALDTINTQYYEGVVSSTPVCTIYKNGLTVMHIADGCNGLELFVLYMGFIVSMPASVKRKISFIIIGVVLIHLVNVFRCVGLCMLVQYLHQYFDIAHHYIFKMIIYSIVFLLWMLFSRKLLIPNNTNAPI